jgi:hypothetical protein
MNIKYTYMRLPGALIATLFGIRPPVLRKILASWNLKFFYC